MCGIVGYTGREQAAPKLVAGLKKLEYRGYDSAGIAVLDGEIHVFKQKGRVSELECRIGALGRTGIGHTRWATHGEPSTRNAHPHVFGRFAVVHNGIVENYLELKEECRARGERFSSETDSEVIAHLLAFYDRGDVLEALQKTASRLVGSYALAVLCQGENALYAARKGSPLIVGESEEGLFLASDVPALADCKKLYALSDGEFAVLEAGGVRFYNEGGEIQKEEMRMDADADFPEKGSYAHFMLKEMHEIPAAIANTLKEFEENFRFSELNIVLCQTEYIEIVACGTAYHSGIAAKYAIERLARIPVEVTVASEYRYRRPLERENTVLIAVSQSGETADTLAAAELAKACGRRVIAVTNVPNSSLSRVADFVLYTRAGREIAVAATKSFNAQLALLYSLALFLAKGKEREQELSLRPFPALAEEVLSHISKLKEFAPEFAKAKSVYFIGRGSDYCAAIEGSLKLKEISYLPSEGYPAGELKHGTLALIEKGTPVVAVLTDGELAEKTMNAVSEVYARGGRVLLVTNLREYAERKEVAFSFLLPPCEALFSPLLSVIPLQALAYYTSLFRGNDPDKPRNLAKSVTVE